MATRRHFLRQALHCLTLLGIASSPIFSSLKWAWGKTQKLILPKGTKRESLINKNPADLDARHLDLTPLQDFGIMGLSDFRVDLGAWRLEVGGQVERSLSLTYEQMIALPAMEKNVLLICPGFFANYGRWKGISVKGLLKKAGVKEGATHVTFRGPKSPYEKVERYPMDDILSDTIFLAYAINGEKLPEKNGFPLRLVAEGHYGYDWVKYVYRVTVETIAKGS